MVDSSIALALQLLDGHYGRVSLEAAAGSWTTFVRIVADRGRAQGGTRRALRDVDQTVLASPSETAEAALEAIEEALELLGRARQKARPLRALARWWLDRFDDSQQDVAWDAGLDTLRGQLTDIRGVSLELADRLLLFVGDLPAYPVDRASMRIACRHGWADPQTDYEEWQSVFVQGLEGGCVSLRRFSICAAHLGKDFCRPNPECTECPLASMLPPSGPYEIE